MGLKGFVKKQAKKALHEAVPGKGASVKGALGSRQVKGAVKALKRLSPPKLPRVPQDVKNVGKGFATLSGIRGVRKVTKALNKNKK